MAAAPIVSFLSLYISESEEKYNHACLNSLRILLPSWTTGFIYIKRTKKTCLELQTLAFSLVNAISPSTVTVFHLQFY